MTSATLSLATCTVALYKLFSGEEDGMSTDQARVKNGVASTATHAHQMLGQRLKSLRLGRRLSLRELAEMTGTSASFISQLERGLTGASTASLNQMASALGVSVAMLFEDSAAGQHGVLRRSERPSLPPSDGCRKMLLSRPPLSDMEVYVGEFDIGGSTGPALYTHGDAHEMLVVLRGIVEVSLGDVQACAGRGRQHRIRDIDCTSLREHRQLAEPR